MKKILSSVLSFVFLCITSLSLVSCSNGTTEEKTEKMQVYASFYAVYDIARTIGGDAAEVHLLCPVGTEPHEYEPKTADMAKLTEADVFVYNGCGMESWAEKVAGTLGKTAVVCASDGIAQLEGSDPHTWLSPMNALKEAENIKNAFAAADPGNSVTYEENFSEFMNAIYTLDSEYRKLIERKKTCDIVVAHAAYGYLCGEYGLNQIAVENAQGGEPSPARMAEIIDTMRAKNIGYICSEALESEKTVEAIAKETGVVITELNPFEGDTSGRSYIDVMYGNLGVLNTILGE